MISVLHAHNSAVPVVIGSCDVLYTDVGYHEAVITNEAPSIVFDSHMVT